MTVDSSPTILPYPFPIPGGSDGKESACDVGDLGSIPGSDRSPGEDRGLGRTRFLSNLDSQSMAHFSMSRFS